MDRPTPNDGYLPSLDGWRAVAVTAVIVCHAKSTFVALGVRDQRLLDMFHRGRLGVDLFFAISGFLICNRLLREAHKTGGISLVGFYFRRAFRIFPLYFAYLGVLAALIAAAGVPGSAEELWACLFFYRNYVSPPMGLYTEHFWSLAVEEHFYLGWPLFLVAVGARRALWLTPFLAVLVAVWRAMDARYNLFAAAVPDATPLFRTDTRIDALLWGCFAALIYVRYPRPNIPTGTSWGAILAIVCTPLLPEPVRPLVIAVLFPILIFSTTVRPDGVLGRLLELPVLRWYGRLSYAVYVWQTIFLFNGRTRSDVAQSIQNISG